MALSGMLAANQLRTIEGTARLVRFDLLEQTNALRSAFLAALDKPLVVTDGYRSYQSQVTVFTSRYTTQYLAGRPYRVWNEERWYQRPGTAAAAVPGTSNHGWAQALDLGSGVNSSLTSPEYRWMRANAPRFGWTHPTWARNAATLEPWHWEAEYVPPSSYTSGGGGGSTPIPPIYPNPPEPEVPDMDANDRAIAQQTLDQATAAHNEAAQSRVAAAAALDTCQRILTTLYSVANKQLSVTEFQKAISDLLRELEDTDRLILAVDESVTNVRRRAALATRKQYSGLVAEKPTYDLLAATYGTYEDMAGIRDPLTATVTVEATVSPGQIEEEVKDALVAAAPALVDAINDDAANRMKE
jgi:hypothetical protein